jgi:type I restriction enzyme, S subunit
MGDYRERILNCPETGSIPDDWRLAALGDLITLQRGNDLPKSQRSDGPFPVVGSNGIVGYHSEFIAKGPGVLVGRSGSVGKVTWVEGDYWPLNTSLWIKDFHGNDPLFIYFLLLTRTLRAKG